MILYAGVPRIRVSLAKAFPQFGQKQAVVVKSFAIRSIKHFTSAPLPPLRYLNSIVLHLVQITSTVLTGCFALGLAILTPVATQVFGFHPYLTKIEPS